MQRIVVGMIDGLGIPAYRASPMPKLKSLVEGGAFFKEVSCVFPSVTNVNNASIVCGSWPRDHGITANSYYDRETGSAVYMNQSSLVRTPTIFARARQWGVRSALLTCKKKSAELFSGDVDLCVVAESPSDEALARWGMPPDIYSKEINWWLWDAAASILGEQSDIGLLYVHTTDYPMHAWHESHLASKEHLSQLDERIAKACQVAPDAALFVTADHGMNAKRRCHDLDKICSNAGLGVRFVLSPERDYYVVHHRNFTGCSFVWLDSPSQREPVRDLLRGLAGVEAVEDSSVVAERFRTDAERLGDLVVFGDIDTMFGEMDSPFEDLPGTYRAHGSLHESEVPLLIHNWRDGLPTDSFFGHNLDLTRFLFRI